jgi:hypothetical protein
MTTARSLDRRGAIMLALLAVWIIIALVMWAASALAEPSPSRSFEAMTTGPDWITLLVGFAGGSLAATVIGALVKHWVMHPVISVRLDRELGSYGPVTVNHFDKDQNVIATNPARFLRLHVENTGLSSIKDCCGYITNLSKHTASGKTVPHKEVLDLGWAHHPQSPSRDIPRGAFFHMDVATLHLWHLASPPQPQRRPRELRPPVLPTTLLNFFDDKGTYELELLIAADNARPQARPIKIPVVVPSEAAKEKIVSRQPSALVRTPLLRLFAGGFFLIGRRDYSARPGRTALAAGIGFPFTE